MFFILTIFCSTLNSWIGEFDNSIFDVTNRLEVTWYNSYCVIVIIVMLISNVWSIKIRTTHNLSLWLYEYFWIILLYGHLVYFILKVLAWEICNMKWGFAKKVIIKSQRQFMYGSNFYGSDVTMSFFKFKDSNFKLNVTIFQKKTITCKPKFGTF